MIPRFALVWLVLAPLAGCTPLANVDDNPNTGGASSSSASSTGAGGTGGQGGAGGFAACVTDADCPGTKNACGEPRCYPDGLCGVENQPIGAPCADDGGVACNGKGDCVECTSSAHCDSGKCSPSHACLPPACNDGIANGDETDVDCGGGCAARCASGQGCGDGADCIGGICEGAICAPTCDDGAMNGGETGVDCGGSACPACPLGSGCATDADCLSSTCAGGVCKPFPTCEDGTTNGGETDVDCGGPACPLCPDGAACVSGSDCVSDACVLSVCTSPSCDDGIKNGDEADVDCGVACPTRCEPGKTCASGADCTSKVCAGPAGGLVCAAPSCFDGVQNGDETSWDCGGSCAAKCPPFYPCLVDGDCVGGVCDPVKLTCSPTCADGFQNMGETDVDCGGPCPTKCGQGRHCLMVTDCAQSLTCYLGHCCPPGDPSCCLDGDCTP